MVLFSKSGAAKPKSKCAPSSSHKKDAISLRTLANQNITIQSASADHELDKRYVFLLNFYILALHIHIHIPHQYQHSLRVEYASFRKNYRLRKSRLSKSQSSLGI